MAISKGKFALFLRKSAHASSKRTCMQAKYLQKAGFPDNNKEKKEKLNQTNTRNRRRGGGENRK